MPLGSADLDRQIEILKRCELIKESEVKSLCSRARSILAEESNVRVVDSPVSVCKGMQLWNSESFINYIVAVMYNNSVLS